MLALHLAESRECGLDAQLFGIPRIDAAEQRLDHPLERFVAQAAAKKRRE